MKIKFSLQLTEKVLLIIVAVALIGMFNVIPGASAVAYFFLYLLAMFYAFLTLPLFLGVDYDGLLKKESYLKMSNNTAVVLLLTGWSLTVILLGMVFKLIHLHNGFVVWIGVLLAVYTLFLATKNKLKRRLKKTLYKRVVLYLLLGMVLGGITGLVSKKTLVKIYSCSDKHVMYLYEKMRKDPANPQYEAEFYTELQKITARGCK